MVCFYLRENFYYDLTGHTLDGQRLILAGKGIFFTKKDTFLIKKAPQPYSIPFLSVLHQNKDLYNFQKRGQHSIVKLYVGLEYALPNLDSLLLWIRGLNGSFKPQIIWLKTIKNPYFLTRNDLKQLRYSTFHRYF